MAHIPNTDIILSEEEKILLKEMKDIHDQKLMTKFEKKQKITPQMVELSLKLGVPELAFIEVKKETPLEQIDHKSKCDTSSKATKFSKQLKGTKIKADKHICNKCGKAGTKTCSRCGSVWYCSKECQIEDWHLSHKLRCKIPVVSTPITIQETIIAEKPDTAESYPKTQQTNDNPSK